MIAFVENQKFSLWYSIGLLGLTAFMIYLLFLTYGTPASWGLLFTGVIPSFLILLLFMNANLYTKIDDKGISIKFFPFHFKYIVFNWSDMDKCEVIKYRPIKDYGGWGIRFGYKDKVYNVKGNRGIHLYLNNGRKILIGTQKEKEADEMIRLYFGTKSS